MSQQPASKDAAAEIKPYTDVKNEIERSRKQFFIKYPYSNSAVLIQWPDEIKDYWVNTVGTELYEQWKGTPWDFNGTTTTPGYGMIACGFFVTTILQDMGLKLNRRKLSICTSSRMMKSLTPQQTLKNMSRLSYADFDRKLKEAGKAVYIIGLDFHTGIIVNDGTENWFIHSNYIHRKGVTKETILQSSALSASKTRWLTSLTADMPFLKRWLTN